MANLVTDRPHDAPVETLEQKRARNATAYESEFLMLGYDHGVYYYLPKGTNHIIPLKTRQHTKGELVELAPLQFWEEKFAGDYTAAGNALIRRQQAVGMYDPSRLRGCGAWWDSGRPVVHVGDRLISEGREIPLSGGGKYIYEHSKPWEINHAKPLSVEESRRLIDICQAVSWDKPINARYLSGWLAIAPICGALAWRPHIWITGAADSGKSFVFREIVSRLVKSISVSVQGDSTSHSIRQSLNSDARPVLFEEAEAEDDNGRERMDGVLELARAASTDDSPPIRKGSPGGIVTLWYIRTSFLWVSVSYTVQKKTDERRITPLGITRKGPGPEFEKLKELCALLTPAYCDRFLSRSIKMIPVIRESSRVFATALAGRTGSQGTGEQLGTLLAGSWSLWSDEVITPKQAEAFLAKNAAEWIAAKTDREETNQAQCWARLRQHVIRAQVKSGPVERTVAELGDISSGRAQDEVLSEKVAGDILGRHGFRGDPDGMVVSVSHAGIAAILKNTPWARNWARTLRRLPDAHATEWGVRFGVDKQRGIEIPWPAAEDEE